MNLNDQLWDTGLAFDFDLKPSGTVPNPQPPLNPVTPLPPIDVIDDISSGCKEIETEEEEEDGIVTTWTKIQDGSCEGDEYESDIGYTPTTVAKYDKDAYLASINNPPATTVPEPGTVALLAAGLAALGVVARRRRD